MGPPPRQLVLGTDLAHWSTEEAFSFPNLYYKGNAELPSEFLLKFGKAPFPHYFSWHLHGPKDKKFKSRNTHEMPQLFMTPTENAVTKSSFPAARSSVCVFGGPAPGALLIHDSSKPCLASNKYTFSVYFHPVTWDFQRPARDRGELCHNFSPVI